MTMREFPDKVAKSCACPNHPRTRYQLVNIATQLSGGVYDQRQTAEELVRKIIADGGRWRDYEINPVDDTIDCGLTDNLRMCLFCNRTVCDACQLKIIVALVDSVPSDADYQRELGKGWIVCGECKMSYEGGRVHVLRCAL